jgi:hypothetical protein
VAGFTGVLGHCAGRAMARISLAIWQRSLYKFKLFIKDLWSARAHARVFSPEKNLSDRQNSGCREARKIGARNRLRTWRLSKSCADEKILIGAKK